MSLFVTPEHLLCVHHRVLDYQTVSLVPLIGPIIHYSSHYLLLSLFASLIIVSLIIVFLVLIFSLILTLSLRSSTGLRCTGPQTKATLK